MPKAVFISAASIELEPWQPEGVTVLDGEPRGRGFTLHEDHTDGVRATGIFACDPCVTTYRLEFNEMLYVLEGEVRIELDNGTVLQLASGDSAFLPKGHQSTWTFTTPFKEFWVLTD